MKKILCLLFVAAFVLSLAACTVGGTGGQETPEETVTVREIGEETLLMHRALIPTTDEDTGETGYYLRGEWDGKSVCWVTFAANGQRFPAPLGETTIYQTQGDQNYFEQVQFSYTLSDGTEHETMQYRIYLAQETQPFPELSGFENEAQESPQT